MSTRVRWILAIAGGLLLGLSFPPIPAPWLAWVALVPLLVATTAGEARTTFLLAFVANLLAYSIAGGWVLLHPSTATTASSAAGMLWLAIIAAVPWTVACLAGRRSQILRVLWLIAATGSLEMFQLYTELGFPWPILGHTQANFEPFNQLAELGGATGLTLWLLMINVALFAAVRVKWPLRLGPIGLAVTLIVAAAWFGRARLSGPGASAPPQTGSLRFLVVQPSLDVGQWADPFEIARMDSLSSLTSDLLTLDEAVTNPPDLIVWPETVLPPTNLQEMTRDARIWSHVEAWGIPLLTGAIEVAPDPDAVSPYRNSAFLFRPTSQTVLSYRKQRLVPFAEYVPYSSRLPFLRRLAVPAGGVWGYAPGARDGLLRLGDDRIGVLLCFESAFGYLARRLIEDGASVIIVLTQDGWWGDSFGYRQHLAIDRLRAIETRYPVVQAAATGISGLVLPSGRIGTTIGWMERGGAFIDVPTGEARTLYLRFGDWPGGFCLVLTVLLILARIK